MKRDQTFTFGRVLLPPGKNIRVGPDMSRLRHQTALDATPMTVKTDSMPSVVMVNHFPLSRRDRS
jgi:hypothetical protein